MPDRLSRNPSTSPADTPARVQRADARNNRARLLQAARDAYALDGTGVPSSAIARRAGVGAATLYRHFPTRDSLIATAFSEQLGQCIATVDEALKDDDPWRGLRTALTKVCRMQAEDRGFSAAFLAEFPDAPEVRRERARAESGLALLVQRAKDTGQLRKDFHSSDITLLLLANNGVLQNSPAASMAASRRLLAYFLQSCRPTDDTPLPEPAPLRLDDLHRAPRRTG
ncbi:TetR/AcrR family transcriptional regulator [Streptomyces smyrnaeus]|uniref:TetR/AcrR family transcriptional regulator n=1 Tax=Streptomyces TaxID=1883 RepID=UPI000C19A6A5|nr:MULTISPECIES: TetR/AcrR family transcriptional regulator [unclassified Streptomyces]MBQ0866970.1 TetR/AcrR family transcriptional regulator [Streptomyces sp. RK75]MBQ1119887.1 TetR/AcrR family transcriptional regulator [Streptomyces sp. B15]MBQ1160833.1 TetR/AcrR family transcriptional regulator [Streptomyces sp. A73]